MSNISIKYQDYSFISSKNRIRIDLKGVLFYKRDLAVSFERCFDLIDEDTAESIMKILNGR